MEDNGALEEYHKHVGVPYKSDSKAVLLRLLDPGIASRLPVKCGVVLIEQWSGGAPEWTDYVMLTQALIEPQAHIVQPVLVKFASLVDHLQQSTSADAGSLQLDFDFVWLSFVRAMEHSNGWIRHWSIQQVLRLLPPSLMAKHTLCFLTDYMRNFNSVDFFSRLLDTQQLESYCESFESYLADMLQSVDNAADLLLSLVRRIVTQQWSPAPCFYYTRALRRLTASDKYRHTVVDEALAALIRQSMEHLANMQVPAIRTATLHNCLATFTQLAPASHQSFAVLASLVSAAGCVPPTVLLDNAVPQPQGVPTANCIDRPHAQLWWLISLGPEPDAAALLDVAHKLLHSVGSSFARLQLIAWAPRALPSLAGQTVSALSTVITSHPVGSRILDVGPSLNWIGQDRGLLLACLHGDCVLDYVHEHAADSLHSLFALCQDGDEALQTCLYLRLISRYDATPPDADKFKSLMASDFNVHLTVLSKLPVHDRSQLNRLRSDLVCDWVECCLRDVAIVDGGLADLVQLVVEPAALTRLLQTFSNALCLSSVHIGRMFQDLNYVALDLDLWVESRADDATDAATRAALLRACSTAVAEQRNAEPYWTVLSAFTQLVCLPQFLFTSDAQMDDLLTQLCSSSVLYNETNRTGHCLLAASVWQGVTADRSGTMPADWVLQLLVQLALLSPVMRKGERCSVHEYCERAIVSESDWRRQNPGALLHVAACERARVFACCSLRHCRDLTRIVQLVVDEVKLDTHGAHFGLSTQHRLRTRAWCLLLYLVANSDIAATEQSRPAHDTLYRLCVDTLSATAAQTSIRLLCEQLLVQLCARRPEYTQRFMDEEMNMFAARVGAVASWLQVLMKLALTRQELYARVLLRCLQWVSALNLHVRCTALAVVRHLLNQRPADQSLPFDVSALHQLIFTPHDTRGSQSKICASLLEDEYFARLPPDGCDAHYIFFTLPFLCGLPEEELLARPLWMFCQSWQEDVAGLFSELRTMTQQAQRWCSVWRGENSNATQTAERCDGPLGELATALQYQTKLNVPVPLEDYSPLLLLPDKPQPSVSPAHSLIVVASLIDKPSNLGGLCRTCEIFGVSKLVLSDVNVRNNAEFKSVCVNADKWLPVQQVNAKYVDEYLVAMKADGYTIVGVEQMSGSQPLPKSKLPARCVLLLGTERQGIPPALIRLLDTAVEIPQLGVVRSLNVHVSAALVVYEFVRQHALL